jgi:ABC-type glycerol-3-phosphate transport system substrate-binding protein
MKSKLIAVLLVMLLTIAGCSSGSKSNSPDDKIATINSMMSKGYEMTSNQQEKINQMTEEGKKLVSQGKTAEANKLLNEAIHLLELIAETDRFNKSE